jgi:hypothetical protein
MLTEDSLVGYAERAQELELLGAALLALHETDGQSPEQDPATRNLRHAVAGLPHDLQELAHLPLGFELWAMARHARELLAHDPAAAVAS